MKSVAWSIALTASLYCTTVVAIGPTIGGPSTGLWYNPTESGRGYEIDIQADTMIVTTYIYTSGGDPIWYLSSGTYNHGTGFFQSTYDSYSDGQCFGCPWSPPVVHGASGGPITIAFHNDQSATLTYPGGSTNIIKYNYGFSSALDVLYGEWAFSYNISGLIGGDWIIFDSPYVGTDGKTYASGHMDLASNDLALASYDPNLGYSVLVSIGSFEDFYQFALDDHRGVGLAWIVPEGGTLVGNGSTAAAGRILFHSEISGGASAPEAGQPQDRSRYVMTQGGAPADPATLARIAQMRRALSEKKASQ